MPNVLSTDQTYIQGVDCNPQKQKKIIFEGSTLKVISGSNTLFGIDFSNFGQFGSEFGGSFKKDVYIQSQQTYTLYGGNISQAQGEVSMIVLMVRYDSATALVDRHISVDYKGKIIPCGTLLFLTGVTKDDVAWHGWDLEPYTNASPIPYSPTISPNVTSPDYDFGGLLIYNPTNGEIEVEILVMN